MKTVIRLRIGKERIFIGKGVRELLEAIDRFHSIKKATEVTGISYPKAMRILKTFDEELGFPAVISEKGGMNRGGTELTEKGKKVLKIYSEIEEEVQEYAKKLVDTKFNF